MINKQELVTALLCRHLSEIKVGIIVKGVDDISPEEIIKEIASEEKHLYAAAIGYDEVIELSEELYDITNSIEKAVLWRSMPECAGSIIVFIKNDTDKLHSLAEFEVITTRDTARYLVETQIKSDNNMPTNNFWSALQATSDYYTFDALYDLPSPNAFACQETEMSHLEFLICDCLVANDTSASSFEFISSQAIFTVSNPQRLIAISK